MILLGDSIRLGYQQNVIAELKGEYEVWGPEENGRFAKYTLNELGRIFAAFSKHENMKKDESILMPGQGVETQAARPDIIHWNNGLWDTATVCEEDGAFTPVDEYISYMAKILRELRKITPKIIFATTTPVNPENLNQNNETIMLYNKRITGYMKKENVYINDLGKLVSIDCDRYLAQDNIHLSDEGKALCAKAVARCVREIDRL